MEELLEINKKVNKSQLQEKCGYASHLWKDA